MLRLNLSALPCLAFIALFASASLASAQSGSRPAAASGADAVAAALGASSTTAPTPPATETADQGRGWLFRSALLNITKPEVKAPAVEWDGEAAGEAIEQAAAEGKSRLMQPIYRVRDAAIGAMERTRTAWNSRLERMKFSRDDAESSPTRLARWFGAGGEAPAATAPADGLQQPEQVYRR